MRQEDRSYIGCTQYSVSLSLQGKRGRGNTEVAAEKGAKKKKKKMEAQKKGRAEE